MIPVHDQTSQEEPMLDRSPEMRTRLRAQVAEAARVVFPTWPLGTFVSDTYVSRPECFT